MGGWPFKTENNFDELERREMCEKMRFTGELDVFKKSDNWQKAFDLYKKMTGQSLDGFGCSTCYVKVKEWLTR